MNYPQQGYGITPSPQQPKKSWARRHKISTGILGIVALFVVIGVIGAALGSPSTGTPAAVGSSSPQASPGSTQAASGSTSPAPQASPNPDASYQGSCDYTLSSSIYGNDHLIGEVDQDNTGNIGVVVRVRITWPQEGAPPITARKTVQLPYGASNKPVRFHVPVASGGNVINQLQSWQENHNFKNGCTYHATILRTYGSAH